MNKESFDKYVEIMKDGGMPVTLGFLITYEQFLIFAHEMSEFIYKYGWVSYREYMNLWWSKVDPREIKKRKLIY